MPLLGKTALVINATCTAGEAAAEALALAGARVMLNYPDRRDAAERLAERIRNRGGQAMAFRADIMVAGELRSLCDVLLAYWGRPDILVGDASHGVALSAALGQTDPPPLFLSYATVADFLAAAKADRRN
ncbi:SDR family NAD(P)-dependent oxidoreductase [Methylomonas koyamae]|uniref:SDR family NAD(P)-dependent oxidoreductase n=1 Tax=Methylomonas koyamae TaxID=702114 RepID=UPI002110542E|nr:SDR family NAD(P)-dependent oxidoreductase [Methylomonas koyamae]